MVPRWPPRVIPLPPPPPTTGPSPSPPAPPRGQPGQRHPARHGVAAPQDEHPGRDGREGRQPGRPLLEGVTTLVHAGRLRPRRAMSCPDRQALGDRQLLGGVLPVLELDDAE